MSSQILEIRSHRRPQLVGDHREELIAQATVDDRHRAPNEQLASRPVVVHHADDTDDAVFVAQRIRLSTQAADPIERDILLRLSRVEHATCERGERLCGQAVGPAGIRAQLDQIAIDTTTVTSTCEYSSSTFV